MATSLFLSVFCFLRILLLPHIIASSKAFIRLRFSDHVNMSTVISFLDYWDVSMLGPPSLIVEEQTGNESRMFCTTGCRGCDKSAGAKKGKKKCLSPKWED